MIAGGRGGPYTCISNSQDARDADHVAGDLPSRKLPPGHDETGGNDADGAAQDAEAAGRASRRRGLYVEL